MLAGAALAGGAAALNQARPPATVTVQLLALNDFHGNLEPVSGPNGQIAGTPAGGAEYLATHLKNAVARNPHSIVVAAGDLIGASPLLSGLFHDEPTIEALNAMQLAIAAVGNHEFDEGADELLRMQNGGCHPTDGCQDGDGFSGAAFQYLSANVQKARESAPLLPATAVRTFGGVKVGFIGETLRTTPRIVTPTGVAGLTFLDEAETANAYAALLKQEGVHAIVLLIHEGGRQEGGGEPNGCAGFGGAIVPIVNRLSPDIDVVISGHTHESYNCTIGGRYVTSASSLGRMLTRIDLTIDAANGTITAVSASNDIVTREVVKDPAQSRIIAKYAARSGDLASRIVGTVPADLLRTANRAGESALGDVIADAQLASTKAPAKGAAVVAFTNAGGIRSDVIFNHRSRDEQPGQVTYSELFTVQPFNNVMIVQTMTGDMIRRLLEQQFGQGQGAAARVLQVSRGFTYSYRLNAPAGGRVVAGSIKLAGRAIRPDDRLRVAASNFLTAGGDGLTVFTEGTEQLGGDSDIDALVGYFGTDSPVEPGPQDRIVRVD